MVKTDSWIRAQCSHKPEYKLMRGDQCLGYLAKPYSSIEQCHIRDLLDEINGVRHRRIAIDAVYAEAVSKDEFSPMITPFIDGNIREVDGTKVISYGLSSMGYDVRLAKGLKVFTDVHSVVIDPKGLDPKSFVDMDDDVVVIPPNGFALGHTVETFNIPRDVVLVCLGKSTYARAGVNINITPIEPGFKGQVVIEIANLTNSPVKIYTGEGISQFLFYQSDENCQTSYADKNGKYQNQKGIQLPLV